MKIIPLADRVVIKTVEVEETTKGGLILTGSAKEKPQVCEVIAVGPGGVVDGKEVKMTVKVGDKEYLIVLDFPVTDLPLTGLPLSGFPTTAYPTSVLPRWDAQKWYTHWLRIYQKHQLSVCAECIRLFQAH